MLGRPMKAFLSILLEVKCLELGGRGSGWEGQSRHKEQTVQPCIESKFCCSRTTIASVVEM